MKTSKITPYAILIIFSLAGAAGAYNGIIDLGGLDGYPVSYARYINDWGKIVGWVASDDPNDSNTIACLFDNTGGGANINLGGPGSVALCSLSRIIGQSAYYNPGYPHYLDPPVYNPNYSHACIFDMTGDTNNILDLGTLVDESSWWIGENSSGAQSISHSGQIVGYAFNDFGFYLACLFDQTGGGNNINLGTLGGYVSEALSNNDSQIVGYADNNSNCEHACIFDPTGDANNIIDLGTLGGNCSAAWSINESGQIAGWALDDGSYHYHACLFDPTGDANNNIDLGTLGGDNSEAYFIADNGQIIGYALDGLGQPRACLFDPTGGGNNIDLNTLIDPCSGLTLTRAFCMSSDGLIVGTGVRTIEYYVDKTLIIKSQERAFLLVTTAITLTNPNGGEILTGGNIHSITWTATSSIDNVLIEYSPNNGQDWNYIASVPNTGSYDWLVPTINSSQCLVRISNFAGQPVSDTSNAVFTIANKIYVDNDAPNDPEPNNPDYSDPLEDGTPEHPFDAIQEGIDAAVISAAVIVQPGVYTGNGNYNIEFKGKAITVQSIDPNDADIVAATIIDCNGANHRGFIFVGGEGQDSILEGLTIANAHLITICEGGAGIYMDGASPTINRCIITNNHAELVPGSHHLCLGGGIYIGAESNPLITNCTISDNSVGDWGWGAGVYCDYFAVTHATLRNCLISNNTALGYEGIGGGICCDCPSDLTVTNCTIVNNASSQGGGGIYFYMYQSPVRTITDSIIWGNSPDQIYPVDKTNISVTYSDIQGGWPDIGNIDVEPYFVDEADGDYHLKSEGWSWDQNTKQWTWDDETSRCIDAGNPGRPLGNEPVTLDADPQNRWGQNLRINMGMYGDTPEASMPPYGWALLADLDNDGKVGFADYSYLANLYGEEGQNLNGDLNRDGKVNISDISLIAFDWLEFTDWIED
jgi:probable HAF family extracellular repeat protein